MLSAAMQLIQGGWFRCTRTWQGRTQDEARQKIWIAIEGAARHGLGGDESRLVGGHVYLVPAHPRQSWGCDRRLDLWWFHFRPESVVLDRRLTGLPVIRGWPLSRWKHWEPVYRRLDDYFTTGDELLGLRLQAFAAEVAAAALADAPPHDPVAERRLRRLAPAIEAMDRRFAAGVAISELARTCGLSLVHFHREFSLLLRCTPRAYLERRRIDLAQQLLRATADDVGAVAARCGYDDPFYFSRVFRRVVGRSPTQYRLDPARA